MLVQSADFCAEEAAGASITKDFFYCYEDFTYFELAALLARFYSSPTE